MSHGKLDDKILWDPFDWGKMYTSQYKNIAMPLELPALTVTVRIAGLWNGGPLEQQWAGTS